MSRISNLGSYAKKNRSLSDDKENVRKQWEVRTKLKLTLTTLQVPPIQPACTCQMQNGCESNQTRSITVAEGFFDGSEMLPVGSERVVNGQTQNLGPLDVPVQWTAAELFFVQTMGLELQSEPGSFSDENPNDVNTDHSNLKEPECVPPVPSRFSMWKRPSDDEDEDWENSEDGDGFCHSEVSNSDDGSDTSDDDDYRSEILDNGSTCEGGDMPTAATHNDVNYDSILRAAPTILEASQAHTDIQLVLRPPRKNGQGYKDPGLDLLL